MMSGFSLQTSGTALQSAVYVYLQTQWSRVCQLLGMDLPWRGRNSPSYRGPPGQPTVSAHSSERNGALCTDALCRRYDPFTARPLLHSWLSCGSRMVIAAGRRRTLDWPPRTPDMNPIENMWSEVKRKQCRKPGLSTLPETAMSYGPLCLTRGMKLLRLRGTFDHWLSPWHDKWNRWSKQKGFGLLIKEVSFWKQPF